MIRLKANAKIQVVVNVEELGDIQYSGVRVHYRSYNHVNMLYFPPLRVHHTAEDF